MKQILLIMAMTITLAAPAYCATTPMDTELPEDSEIMIECDRPEKFEANDYLKRFYNFGKPSDLPPSREKITIFHYRLYIPKGYHESKQLYPCLFIASPGGNATMGNMKDRLVRDRWIVVMLVESSNTCWFWVENFLTAHDDVMKRVRVNPNFKFATGMSGGSRCSSIYPMSRDGFRGVFLQAAGFAWQKDSDLSSFMYSSYPEDVAVTALFGDTDMNISETQEVRRDLNPKCGRDIFSYSGGHGWAPTEVFERAMDWMEEEIYLNGNLPKKGSAEACRWYYDNWLPRLKETKDKAEQYNIIQALLSVTKAGKLTKDEDIKEVMDACGKRLSELKKMPEVQPEIAAEKLFRKAEKSKSKFAEQMQKGKAEYKKVTLSKDDLELLDGYRKNLQKVIDKYPETKYGQKSKAIIDSFAFEYAKTDSPGR